MCRSSDKVLDAGGARGVRFPGHDAIYRLDPMIRIALEGILPVGASLSQRLLQARREAGGITPAGPKMSRHGHHN